MKFPWENTFNKLQTAVTYDKRQLTNIHFFFFFWESGRAGDFSSSMISSPVEMLEGHYRLIKAFTEKLCDNETEATLTRTHIFSPSFPPTDFQWALLPAAEGRSGPTSLTHLPEWRSALTRMSTYLSMPRPKKNGITAGSTDRKRKRDSLPLPN